MFIVTFVLHSAFVWSAVAADIIGPRGVPASDLTILAILEASVVIIAWDKLATARGGPPGQLGDDELP